MMRYSDLYYQDHHYGDLDNKDLNISSYVILMRQAEILFEGWIDSTTFRLSSIDDSSLQKYNDTGMGVDRLAGLDVRACGDFLIHDFFSHEEKERQAMAGLPWQKLAEMINSKHQKAFTTLCGAVEERG